MAAIGEDDLVDGNSASAWVAFDLLATAADGLETIDRASLLEAITTVSSYDGGGMQEAVDFSAAAPDPAYPRMFNRSFSPMVIQDGELSPEPTLDQFIPNFGNQRTDCGWVDEARTSRSVLPLVGTDRSWGSDSFVDAQREVGG